MNSMLHAILQATIISQCVLVSTLHVSCELELHGRQVDDAADRRATERQGYGYFDEQEDFHTAPENAGN